MTSSAHMNRLQIEQGTEMSLSEMLYGWIFMPNISYFEVNGKYTWSGFQVVAITGNVVACGCSVGCEMNS